MRRDEGAAGVEMAIRGDWRTGVRFEESSLSLVFPMNALHLPARRSPRSIRSAPKSRERVVGALVMAGAAFCAAAAWAEAPWPPTPRLRIEGLDMLDVLDAEALGQRWQPALSRWPGVSVSTSLGPGREVGEGDVDVDVDVDVRAAQARRWRLDLGADNHGNRHAGHERGGVAGHVDGLLVFGDRLTASGAIGANGANGGKGWDGAAAYHVPLGTRGTRVALTAGHHHYELGGEFAPLGARGLVDSVGLMSMVPLTTRGAGRLSWQLGVEARRMRNGQRSVAIEDRRRAIAVTTGLQAMASASAGLAIWGGVWMEAGSLQLREAAAAARDAQSVRSAGEYLILSADLALLKQRGPWGLLLRGNGQITDKNLDGSRRFALGGARSVRAWPLAETSGDIGALGQAELRYRWQTLEPFGFVDAGRVKFHHTSWETGARGRMRSPGRMLAGAGVGLRWQRGPWSAEGTAGWRLGSAAQRRSVTGPAAKAPQVWVSMSYSL